MFHIMILVSIMAHDLGWVGELHDCACVGWLISDGRKETVKKTPFSGCQ